MLGVSFVWIYDANKVAWMKQVKWLSVVFFLVRFYRATISITIDYAVERRISKDVAPSQKISVTAVLQKALY